MRMETGASLDTGQALGMYGGGGGVSGGGRATLQISAAAETKAWE